ISCSGLTSITIPDSVKNLNLSCCGSLTSITIPNGVETIDLHLCDSLTNVIIPDSVTSIVSFANCSSLESVTIGYVVTSIGQTPFRDCGKLTRVDYVGTIESWCGIAFKDYYSCPFNNDYNLYINGELVTDLVIPDTVTAINWRAFSGCTSLTSVTIPVNIGYFAFSGCTGLTSVTILEGAGIIRDNAFAGCTGLTTVTVRCPYYPSLGRNVFENCSALTAIYVPADSLESYKTYGWSDYVDLIMPIEE
ncbi:MAG: leucine-rich repeat domain-containing protein, partial [Spirochaetales bacterium]|nr:leucine-rich repeat domain-containing protein [Spirochaetales bacterium]